MKTKVYYFQKTDATVTLQRSMHVENEKEQESHVETWKLNAAIQILLEVLLGTVASWRCFHIMYRYRVLWSCNV